MLTAYCAVPSANQPSDGEQVSAIVAAIHHRDEARHHVNPWAKDPDDGKTP